MPISHTVTVHVFIGMQTGSYAAFQHLHVRATATCILCCFEVESENMRKEMEIYTNGCWSLFIMAIWPLRHKRLWFKVTERQDVWHCCRYGICFYRHTEKNRGRDMLQTWEKSTSKSEKTERRKLFLSSTFQRQLQVKITAVMTVHTIAEN